MAEVERNLKLQDAVMKYMTVQTNDEVDLAALTIDPEEIKLGKLELPPEAGEGGVAREAARPRRLGSGRAARPPADGQEFADDAEGERGDRDRGDRAEAVEATADKAKPEGGEEV